MIKKLRRQQVA